MHAKLNGGRPSVAVPLEIYCSFSTLQKCSLAKLMGSWQATKDKLALHMLRLRRFGLGIVADRQAPSLIARWSSSSLVAEL
jgi:hypothetical protein